MTECTHAKTRSWPVKSGVTQKCKLCGAKQRWSSVAPSPYRQFLPGLVQVDPDGVFRIEQIEVTSCMPSLKPMGWVTV